MDKIKVIENVLTEEEIKNALNILNSKNWIFGHQSITDNSFAHTPFWNMNLIEESYFTDYIKNIIEKIFFKKFKINRCYANGQTYGQDGSYHTDVNDNENEKNNKFTFCLYFSKIKDEFIEAAGGHLFFKIPELKYKICFEPIFNRGILFPSDYLHKAHSYNRYIMDLRMCVSWKLEEI